MSNVHELIHSTIKFCIHAHKGTLRDRERQKDAKIQFNLQTCLLVDGPSPEPGILRNWS